MKKQEEIREEIARKLAFFACSDWDTLTPYKKQAYLNQALVIMRNLHSQGVVIKVDKELPKPNIQLDEKFRMGWDACGGAITNVGYVATTPLVEE